MTTRLSLTLGLLFVGGLTLEARANPLNNIRWTTWTRTAGVSVYQVPQTPVVPVIATTPAPVAVPAPAAAVAINVPASTWPVPAAPAPAPSYPQQFSNLFASLATTPAPVSAPTPAPAPVVSAPVAVAAPPASSFFVPAATVTSTAPNGGFPYDAKINMSSSGFLQSSMLTTGNPQPWFDSPVVQGLYGGVPNAQQQADFSNTVLQRVESTFHDSGIANVKITNDPTASAAHELSVVSNTSFSANPDAIGITDVGNNGFSFIDKLPYAKSVDELEWAVAHNVSHELMHAFGGEHRDTTGQYLDAASSPWSVLIDPKTIFSPAETADLLTKDFQQRSGPDSDYGAQTLSPQPVPEPATLALWAVAGSCVALARRRTRRPAR